jgi:dihydrofolate reductase
MRKIIVYIATSADGFIARKDGGIDWLDRPTPKGVDYGLAAFYKSIDTILYGRKTYDVAVKFVEQGMPIPTDTRVRNYVFSRRRSPKKILPGFEFVKEPIKKFTKRLRAQKGKDIWMMGGGGIIASFLDAGEIDEFAISVIPVFIGEGIPLIAPRHRTVPLKLLSTKKFSDGVVSLHYAVEKTSTSGKARSRKKKSPVKAAS